MPSDLPIVSCLCPTYLRSRLLENVITCFEAQDYPADRRELIVLDDSGQIDPQTGPSWEVVTIDRRFRSLPEKFNAIAGMARGDVLVVWEDDDVYLPQHISAHVKAIQKYPTGFSKPMLVLSTYTGKPMVEDAAGRFHASIAFTRELFDKVGGWPLTKRGDFDQQFMATLATTARGIADPSDFKLTYCFRWGSTNAYHGQAFMRSGQDEEWYDRIPQPEIKEDGVLLNPRFDAETAKIYEMYTSVK